MVPEAVEIEEGRLVPPDCRLPGSGRLSSSLESGEKSDMLTDAPRLASANQGRGWSSLSKSDSVVCIS